MTITQLIQSSPTNANELFAKLAATTNGAVKTRESLFDELKAELELHSRIEEEHLFPVLRKHKETKNLVRAAVNDNKRARSLASELDEMGKEGEEFLGKLNELRRVFQQHVRDEKKELLPAVKTALSNEEAQAITEKVEAERAAREEAKRNAAEERRAAARGEREKVERRRLQAEARKQRAREKQKRQQAEIRAEKRRARQEEARREAEVEAERRRARKAGAALARTGENVVKGSQAMAASGAAAVQGGTEATVRSTQHMQGVVGEALGTTGASLVRAVETYSDRAVPAMESMQALAGLAPAISSAAAEVGKTWLDLMRRTAESRRARSMALMHSLMPPQIAQVQSRYMGETMQAWMEANTRMLDISVETYRSMVKPVERTTESSKEARKSV